MRFANFKFRMNKPKAMITDPTPDVLQREHNWKRAIGFIFLVLAEKVLSCETISNGSFSDTKRTIRYRAFE